MRFRPSGAAAGIQRAPRTGSVPHRDSSFELEVTAALPDGHKDSLILGDAVLHGKPLGSPALWVEESGDKQM